MKVENPADRKVLRDNEGCEFFMMLRRNAGLEARHFPVVTTFNHLSDFVQARDDGGLLVRDFQFQKFARRAQLRSQFRKQICNAFAGRRRDWHDRLERQRVRVALDQRQQRLRGRIELFRAPRDLRQQRINRRPAVAMPRAVKRVLF